MGIGREKEKREKAQRVWRVLWDDTAGQLPARLILPLPLPRWRWIGISVTMTKGSRSGHCSQRPLSIIGILSSFPNVTLQLGQRQGRQGEKGTHPAQSTATLHSRPPSRTRRPNSNRHERRRLVRSRARICSFAGPRRGTQQALGCNCAPTFRTAASRRCVVHS